MGVGEDRISELYDPLIYLIFSFLPVKCVVATSVLSKRWKDLWISNPIIDIRKWRRRVKTSNKRMLENVRYQETYKLGNFLDRMLVPSNDMLSIKKFCLKYGVYYESEDSLLDNNRIYGWISTLIMRRVEELSLCLTKNFLLPPCLFTSETLIMLEIEMAGDLSTKIKKTGTLGFPQAISFRRLKILHLKHMVFVDEGSSAQLFSSCPVLEELMLTDCYMMKKKVLHISVASLKRLFITNSKKYSFKIKIYSPNLQSLTYVGIPEDYVLMDHGFASLVDADINIAFEILNGKIGKQARKCGLRNLLGGISKAKLLKISGSTLESLFYDGFFASRLPTFHNLRRLEVSSKRTCVTVTTLVYLLSTLPNLESIVIAQGFSQFNQVNDFGRQKVPECLLLHLKAVEVREFNGSKEELNVISFFLKESLILRTMDIVFSSTFPQSWKDFSTLPQGWMNSPAIPQEWKDYSAWPQEWKDEFRQWLLKIMKDHLMQQILMFPKGSTDCAINFSS
ncbi:F-box/FBD/LRR-repeat protein At2g26030-like [Papaver somniferum]|uniref:F-box/FBD/LRR-repeat protein At2g26030-like n=1 Tax=Papaver somniferum TaxID=3469 RepID=UPI000E6F9052|nr:F-box/FBD/LRR-repeat protein At2g26030-like [Papaver somniferum]